MKKLRELYEEHKGKVSDKWDIYLEEYDRFFMPYRDEEINLLEIGVQNGGSLEIWSKYFPNAKKLIGCDINQNCTSLRYEDPRIKVIVDDANTDIAESQIIAVSDNFDIIIDDGSHTSADIIKTFCRYFNYLNDDGVFIAEDLHCSYWQEYEGGIYHPYSSIAFFKSLADVINQEHWGVEKSQQDYLSLFAKRYRIDISNVDFSKIHSVEFVNSVCVVRKKPTQQNSLGNRFIAGVDELVVTGHHDIQKRYFAPDQKNNKFSNFKQHPVEEVLALRRKNQEFQLHNDKLKKKYESIVDSTSWRVTRPLRYIGRCYLKSKAYIRNIFAVGGGFRPTLKKALKLLCKEGPTGVKRGVNYVLTRSRNVHSERNNYVKWLARYDTLNKVQRQKIKNQIESLTVKPLISIIMPVYNANTTWLIEAIESVQNQLYANWELCIADDKSTDPEIRPLLERYAQQDNRIKLAFREQNGHISAASNSALALATGDWIALMDQDDLLPEHALFWVVDAIRANPETKLIYSDEDKINANGVRHEPYFKCDWNRDLFYSQNMICHLGVYYHQIVKEIGGFRIGFEGSQDYDLALRFIERISDEQIHHIPRVLYHWRVHPESTASGMDAKPYASIAGEKALNEHFVRSGIKATVTSTNCGYRVSYQLPSPKPLVSLIIPTRNGLELIKTCVESILNITRYDNYEILIVDNGSDDLACLGYFKQLEAAYPQVKVIRDERPFNYSALNNSAVHQAAGEFIGLINNDIEVIEPDWLNEMVSLAIQPDIGAVGAKLLYPNNRVQHAGVLVGMGRVAGHLYKDFNQNASGYYERANLINGYSAVTAACLVVSKQKFEAVNGLNEQDLTVAFNDVDFCLKLKEKGLRNVFTPYALLYHHESASRGAEDNPEKIARFQKEIAYMRSQWSKYIQHDPCYSPNLTLEHADCSLAWPPRIEI